MYVCVCVRACVCLEANFKQRRKISIRDKSPTP